MRKVFVPRTLSELWDCLDEASRGGASPDDGSVSVYAGGTDLLVKMRSGLIHPSTLVCLDRIGELKEIAEEGDEVRMGACATHARLLRHPSIAEHFTVLAQALRGLGSPLIRNMGTIGGNLCTASRASTAASRSFSKDRRFPSNALRASGQTTTVGATLPQAKAAFSTTPPGEERRRRAARLATEQAKALRWPTFSK